MILLFLALLLLTPAASHALLILPYDVPNAGGGAQTICPNATFTNCTTGFEENDITLKDGIDAIDADSDGVADQAAELETDPTDNSTTRDCPATEFVDGQEADGSLSCSTPAGSGDMSQATWDAEFDTDAGTDGDGAVDAANDVICSNCLTSTEIGAISLEDDATDQYLVDIQGTEPASGLSLTAAAGQGFEVELLDTGAGGTVLQRDEDNSIWETEQLWTPITFWTSDASNYLGSLNETQCQYIHRQSRVQDLRAFFRDPLGLSPSAPVFQIMVDDGLDMANSVDLCTTGDITTSDTGDGTQCVAFVDLDTECTALNTPWTGCSGTPGTGTVCENSAGVVGTEGCSAGQIPKGFWLCLQAVTAADIVQSGVSAWLSID